ncbi:MAG: fibronectin type III domain-containing protein [Nitrospirae bacterium]|nr:fibronectin type III domain-containing protein [Nitrospirota bacterium]
MKKLLLITLLLSLIFTNVNCGGGVGSSNSSEKTQVNINIGKASSTDTEKEKLSKVTSTIPANIASIRFTITAPDIATIERVVSVAGKESISETFEILNGTNRRFLIEALDVSGRVLYRKETFVDLDGSDVILVIDMAPTDLIPPVFSGLSAINSITATSLTVSWEPGDDNVTTPDKIQYLIYRSDTPGGEDFESPDYTTTGAGSFGVTGLTPATTYYFVVRAKDETGNIDTNSIEMSAATLTPPDTTAPDFGGVTSVVASSSTVLNLSWSPAADNITASSNIVYNIYRSTTPGGENFTSPNYTTTPGAISYPVTGLSPGATYYFVVRAKDEAGNIDDNTVEKSATTRFIDLTVSASLIDTCSDGCLQFNVTVSNTGTINAGSALGYYFYENCSDGCFEYCQVFSTDPIAANSSVPVELPAPNPGNPYYLIIIDPDNTISETNESNNETCAGSACVGRPSFTICQ